MVSIQTYCKFNWWTLMSLDFDSARLYNPNITPSHEEWRAQLRRFVDAEIMPHAEDWDEAGEIPTELAKSGGGGFVGIGLPRAVRWHTGGRMVQPDRQ